MTSELFVYTPEYLDIILEMGEIIIDTVSAPLGKKAEINKKGSTGWLLSFWKDSTYTVIQDPCDHVAL